MVISSIKQLAAAVVEECGDWMLGELGDQGLRDVIWDLAPGFADLPTEEQDRLVAAVSREIYG